ncbi:MAG: DUF1080 domain-containing protein [Planctomycetia bacterium]|nr:DUF1080 domain-containing protein [Planctomycetia bacterium]
MRILVGILLLSLFVSVAVAAEPEAGFVSLFDGKSLAGWTTAPGAYAVEDGAIVCVAGSKGNLLSEREYADFVIRFDFKLSPGANNGLAIRSPLKQTGNLHVEGIELQILDNSAEKYKTIKPYQYNGSVYGIVAAKQAGLKPVGEWNSQEVHVEGRHIKITLNGTVIVDADLDKASTPTTLDGVVHPGLARPKGHLGFLGHGDRIDVRNIRIKELK